MTSSQLGHLKVAEPRSNSPFPQDMHFSVLSMILAEYQTYI
jgi:hypothetical protein